MTKILDHRFHFVSAFSSINKNEIVLKKQRPQRGLQENKCATQIIKHELRTGSRYQTSLPRTTPHRKAPSLSVLRMFNCEDLSQLRWCWSGTRTRFSKLLTKHNGAKWLNKACVNSRASPLDSNEFLANKWTVVIVESRLSNASRRHNSPPDGIQNIQHINTGRREAK